MEDQYQFHTKSYSNYFEILVEKDKMYVGVAAMHVPELNSHWILDVFGASPFHADIAKTLLEKCIERAGKTPLIANHSDLEYKAINQDIFPMEPLDPNHILLNI